MDYIDVLVQAQERSKAVDTLMERISGHPTETLSVLDEDGALRTIPTAEIVTVSVSGKHLRIVTRDNMYSARQSLQSLEQSLNPRLFVRVSRYELVNLSKVLRYDFTLSGTLRLELVGGMEAWASRRCIPQIRRRLSGKE